MGGKQGIFAPTLFSTSSLKVLAGQDYDHDRDKAITIYTIVNITTPASIQPGISHTTHLSLAIVFTVLFALLFLMILLQLCLILYFGHRRLSYQSVFLFIYLFWAALRTTLFSCYLDDSSTTGSFHMFTRWLLFAVPIYLQFLTLSLLTLYLAKVRGDHLFIHSFIHHYTDYAGSRHCYSSISIMSSM